MGKYAKAIAGAVAAGAAALVTALNDDVVTAGEWITVALALVGGLGVVYAAPKNKEF